MVSTAFPHAPYARYPRDSTIPPPQERPRERHAAGAQLLYLAPLECRWSHEGRIHLLIEEIDTPNFVRLHTDRYRQVVFKHRHQEEAGEEEKEQAKAPK